MSIVAIKVVIISTVPSVYFYLFFHTTLSSKSIEPNKKDFQNECITGARMGEGSIMASFWGRSRICFQPRVPPNDSTTEYTPSLDQASTIFKSGLCNCAIHCKEFQK